MMVFGFLRRNKQPRVALKNTRSLDIPGQRDTVRFKTGLNTMAGWLLWMVIVFVNYNTTHAHDLMESFVLQLRGCQG